MTGLYFHSVDFLIDLLTGHLAKMFMQWSKRNLSKVYLIVVEFPTCTAGS